MNKQEEIRACLNCKLHDCVGDDFCPVLQLAKSKKTIKVLLLVKLLRLGYDPAEILFAVIEGGVPE